MALHQTKKLLHDNGNCINKVKRQLTEWDNIFANEVFDTESETAPVYCLVECFRATHSTERGTEE